MIESALEQVLLNSLSRRSHFWRGSDGPLVLEQSFQYADRGVKRGAGTLRCFAVPSTVFELLVEEAAHEALGRVSKVCSQRERTSIDAWLHFALEEDVSTGLWRAQVPATS